MGFDCNVGESRRKVRRARRDWRRDALVHAHRRATISAMKSKLLKKFEDEIMQLDKELKTELPQEIKRARELGDLRENAEYHAAKERQRLVESRLSLLKKRVSDIHLMNLDKIPRDKVGFGSTVHLKEPGTANITIYQLVMPEDADVEQGLISTASPIGRALLNKEEGDEVTVTTPSGSRNFELVKLLTIHDGV
jgi:transcription elongation factor GreA